MSGIISRRLLSDLTDLLTNGLGCTCSQVWRKSVWCHLYVGVCCARVCACVCFAKRQRCNPTSSIQTLHLETWRAGVTACEWLMVGGRKGTGQAHRLIECLDFPRLPVHFNLFAWSRVGAGLHARKCSSVNKCVSLTFRVSARGTLVWTPTLVRAVVTWRGRPGGGVGVEMAEGAEPRGRREETFIIEL